MLSRMRAKKPSFLSSHSSSKSYRKPPKFNYRDTEVSASKNTLTHTKY